MIANRLGEAERWLETPDIPIISASEMPNIGRIIGLKTPTFGLHKAIPERLDGYPKVS